MMQSSSRQLNFESCALNFEKAQSIHSEMPLTFQSILMTRKFDISLWYFAFDYNFKPNWLQTTGHSRQIFRILVPILIAACCPRGPRKLRLSQNFKAIKCKLLILKRGNGVLKIRISPLFKISWKANFVCVIYI